MAAPIVSFRDVHKSFGNVEVLKGVSLDIEEGKVVAILGRSGSGKSTALRCINGLEKINTGELDVCGRKIDSQKFELRKLRQEVGIVFQSYNLFPHITVEQNVTIAPRRVLKLPKGQGRALAEEVLSKVGLLDKIDAYPEQLSGGQQQRVAIARSLAMRPRVLLLDEVTSALDPELTGEVLRVIESLARENITMILVTHEMSFARKVADQIVFMHHGKIWEVGDRTLLDNPQTSELQQFVASGL
jgi:polar amino acid transport system ATP-binding protein